ncbi:MAG: MmcQ/YjbR family DNA-binding protein [Firmicutes bacterium]|nr:MmcQ/YjbR family DNA-binding protein [Bacillota bacterium]MCL1953765.1 MmcQ/YjbR family DNA-binding protein [Bacillota bacterium]
MTRQQFIDIGIQLDFSYLDYPFDDEILAIRHKYNNKIFALIFDNRELFVNLKVNPLEGELLRQNFEYIKPAYHMNKKHWVSVQLLCADVELVGKMVKQSYNLVKPKRLVVGNVKQQTYR